MRLWRAAPRYDGRQSSVRTFIFTLVRRAAVDLARRRSSQHLAGRDGDDVERIRPSTADTTTTTS